MNRNCQIRRTNDEIRRNTEIRISKRQSHSWASFDIRALEFFRYLSFVIRHSTAYAKQGSWSSCTRKSSPRKPFTSIHPLYENVQA